MDVELVKAVKMKILYLRWLDSAITSGWQEAPSEQTGLSEIRTVGYLVYEDGKHVEIAQSSFDGRGEFSGILAIPKSVILERKTIRLQKRI